MILIVEDDIRLAQSIKDCFEHFGLEIKYYTSIKAAIEYVNITIPKLIISDVLLNDNNGFTLLEHIRSNSKFNGTAFIFISGLINSEYVIKAFKNGAQDYIRKPFLLKELELRVNNILKQDNTLKSPSSSNWISNEDWFFKAHKFTSKDISEILLKSFNTILFHNISDNTINSKKLAGLMGIKEYKLKTLIKWKYGLPIISYIKKFKMDIAKEILIDKKGDIVASSKALGFKSQWYFISKFEKNFGETPKTYFKSTLETKANWK